MEFEGYFFLKFHTVSFISDQNKNTIRYKIISPINTDFVPEKTVYLIKDDNGISSKDITNYRDYNFTQTLPKGQETVKVLKNCLIYNQQNWKCDDVFSFLDHSTIPNEASDRFKFTAFVDGKLIFNKHSRAKQHFWKIEWFMRKISCGSVCFIGERSSASVFKK